MRLLYIVPFLFLSVVGIVSEESDSLSLPDSLQTRLTQYRKPNQRRAEALDAAINYYMDENCYSEAQYYVNELSELADDMKDNFWKATALYYQGLCGFANVDEHVFLTSMTKALKIAETLRETQQTQLLLTRLYLLMSAYYSRNNQLPEFQESVDRGLELAENNGFEEMRRTLLNNKGVVLMKMDSHEEAIVQFKKLMDEDNSTVLNPLKNVAACFRHIGQYDSALYYLDSTIRYAPITIVSESAVAPHLIKAYNIKAECFLDLEQWDDALQCLKLSDTLLKQYGDQRLLTTYYLHKADAYNGKEQYETALSAVDSAILLAQETGVIDMEWHAVELKSRILDNKKDYVKEVENLRYFIALTDTLTHRENIQKMHEQELKQEARAIELQYEQQQQAAHQRQFTILVLAFVVVLIAVLVVIIMWLNKKRVASELELRTREITAMSMGKIHNNELLKDVKEKLDEMEKHPEKDMLPGVMRDLEAMINAESKKDFDLHFVQMHPDFYQKLLADFPKLTQNELRLCAFIKSNLSIKEIASINGLSAESVKTARKRLRRSLNLTGEDISLLEFLSKY